MKNIYKTLLALCLVIAMLFTSACTTPKPNQSTDNTNGGTDTLPDSIGGENGGSEDNSQDS